MGNKRSPDTSNECGQKADHERYECKSALCAPVDECVLLRSKVGHPRPLLEQAVDRERDVPVLLASFLFELVTLFIAKPSPLEFLTLKLKDIGESTTNRLERAMNLAANEFERICNFIDASLERAQLCPRRYVERRRAVGFQAIHPPAGGRPKNSVW
ncbi:hypothetical protein LZC95_50270 [Pendulispora brunnea]|uniref:Uncharacterized protein n=1 Tax=Pendulispora brunnea TaxID=2905690 RepID=A0ABZ2K7C5_9BACT